MSPAPTKISVGSAKLDPDTGEATVGAGTAAIVAIVGAVGAPPHAHATGNSPTISHTTPCLGTNSTIRRPPNRSFSAVTHARRYLLTGLANVRFAAGCERTNLWQRSRCSPGVITFQCTWYPRCHGLEKHGGVAALLAREEPWTAGGGSYGHSQSHRGHFAV